MASTKNVKELTPLPPGDIVSHTNQMAHGCWLNPDWVHLNMNVFLFGHRRRQTGWPPMSTGVWMGNVVSLNRKQKLSKQKQAELLRKRKLQAVQKAIHCSQCVYKCEKCGVQIGLEPENERTSARKIQGPYRFCETCSEEYLDYIARLQGRGDSNCYWRNDTWRETWRTWINYQEAMNQYLKSNAFRKLIDELRQTGPAE